MDKIKEIRKKCIEANPGIVELKFGCGVRKRGEDKIGFVASYKGSLAGSHSYEECL